MNRLLSLAVHAAALGMSERTVRNAIASGCWPAKTVCLGRRRLVPLVEHEKLIEDLIKFGSIPLSGSWHSKTTVISHAPPKRRVGRPRKSLALPGSLL